MGTESVFAANHGDSPMIDVSQINELHAETVRRWHDEPIDNPYDGFLHAVCDQHSFNFQLWHEEDVARSPDVSDQRIAEVKRAIDGFNQQRNDRIEKLDELLIAELERRGIHADDAPLNTETPGSAIDRLSIMSLRIYHLGEQLDRDDATDEHRRKVAARLGQCLEQQKDLSRSLGELVDDIFAGRKRLRLYRQMKMYNDPTMNPYLYRRQQLKAS
jgi:hypothetical protein